MLAGVGDRTGGQSASAAPQKASLDLHASSLTRVAPKSKAFSLPKESRDSLRGGKFFFFFKQLGSGRTGLNERLQQGITDTVKLMTGKLRRGKCLQ